MDRGYEIILKAINDKTDKKKQGNDKRLDYYEVVRTGYSDSESMQEYIDSSLKDITEIKKRFR
jgi:hypothetical protein